MWRLSCNSIRGTVDPNFLIPLSFLYGFVLWTRKEDILRSVSAVFAHTMKVIVVQNDIGHRLYDQKKHRCAFFKTSSFVFHCRKKVLQFWNDLRVSKWWVFSFLGELSLKGLELIDLPQASNFINTTQCLHFWSWQRTNFLVLCLLPSVMLRVKVHKRPAIVPAPAAALSLKCQHTSLLESNHFFNYSAIS